MIEETLRDIGLSKNESKIFLMLLSSGPSQIGAISSRAGIHRRNVYDSVERLKGKGFVSWTVRNGKKYFEAANPGRILEIFEERKERMKSIIPLLAAPEKHAEQNIRVYTGREGRKIIFSDKLNCGGEQLVLGAHIPSETASKYISMFHMRRVAKKIRLKMLFPLSEAKAAKYFSGLKYVKARVLPEAFSKPPIAINVYGSNIAFLTGTDEEPVSILIEDCNLAENFRNYFYALWKISKEV